ncbi:hypothetical protein [Kibdelosporangium phytohabitans]|uniref:ATP-grasp domain-containing protein n=1 Tax=Kibdelosporangium phytohabitans TaxID=860235 RepID=A0A0N9I5C8_9PSEU|nr:hypothetical protein [Kibdelosporangium phytohabitans]ALG09776.1 hypothetical protein AOZ06_25315 [Kibdelosporangium phytohabitans]MBE1468849.1 hypothetical protein [Kibdelosporangium phytohabitans]
MYGPGIAVCARPELAPAEPVHKHRHTRDVVSARPIAVAADTPVICSAGGTDPELLAHLRDSGLPVGRDLREFRSEAEFARRVAEALSDGLRMSMEYPQPTALCPDEHSLKSAKLVGHLNNKASITTLVDPRFQAARSIVTRDRLAAATPLDRSWVLKAATDDAHGGSLDVYLHEAGENVVLPAFTDVLDEFVVEEYLQILTNWGLQFSVGADARARLLAVTEQHVDAAGIYTGGRFGAVTDPPAELLAECLATAQRAADLGYRGLCSIDCADTLEGKQVLLDLNFRITSGSIPLLAMRSVRPDDLGRPAESVKLTAAGPLAGLLAEVRPAMNAGGLLIVAGHDTARTDNPVRRSTVQLLLFGDDPAEVTARRQALEAKTGGH